MSSPGPTALHWKSRLNLSKPTANKIEAQFPEKLEFLFEPHRYKCAYGGRGGAKSWGFARALLILGVQKQMRILCARETQKSIQDSVHKLLSDQIMELGLSGRYTVLKSTIIGTNGTEFIFAGIRQNVGNIKSYEACDVVWVEEAQTVSKHSWNVLIPTIRKESSEIWISFNPELESDETYQRFVVNPPSNACVVRINWADNPWIPDVLLREMEDLRARDGAAYDHVYGGTCKQAVEGAIYRAELLAAEKEGRLMRVPYDAIQPVHTFWDLGFGDNTSIWFAQSMPFEFRIIDHLSGSLQALQYYVKQLQERPYVYGTHWLPHDGKAHELGTGRSIEEQLKLVFGKDKVRCTPRLSMADGIAATRAIFGRCWFDREKCADGIQSLRHYRYEHDEHLGAFKREPLHDWASHDADAFRTLAVAIKELQKPEESRASLPHSLPTHGGAGGWMT
jgi:phage terminase large subunit